MTPNEVQRLLAILTAAYRIHLEPHEVVVYVDVLQELKRTEVADAAIATLIRNQPRFPAISEIRKAYADALQRMPDQNELDEPELTAEQREYNIRMAKNLMRRMQSSMSERSAKLKERRTKPLPKTIWTNNPNTWPKEPTA